MEEFLKQFNFSYEDLTTAERETLNGWLKIVTEKQVTVNDILTYCQRMIRTIEGELSEPDIPQNKDLFLKARLKNCLLLEQVITAPEKVRKQIEQALKNLTIKKQP